MIKNWLSKNLNTIIIGSFLIPILLVAIVSISHVITFYNLANPIKWATYLSIAVEIAALAALAGVSAKFGKFIYIPFGIVTFIQLLGNFYFSYSWINVNSIEFKDWMEMITPMLEPLGVDVENPSSHRRILAFVTGGLLPFISLTFAHMLIVYSTKMKNESEELIKSGELSEENVEEISKEAGKKEKEIVEKYKPYSPTQEDLTKLQELFESKYGFGIQNDDEEILPEPTVNENIVDLNDVETILEEDVKPEPTPTPDPIYFVDDEPVIEEHQNINKVNRLVYKKDE